MNLFFSSTTLSLIFALISLNSVSGMDKTASKINVSNSKQSDYIAQVSTTAITNIRLNSTDKGLEVILETSSNSNLQPLIYPDKNTLIIDILDAVLTLPDGEQEFFAENPTDAITEIKVTQLNENGVRITITGKINVPIAQIVPSSSNLVLSLTPSENPKSEDEIEIVATQEAQQQRGYFVPKASTGTGTDTPIIETPFSVQVVPQQVIRSQQATNIQEVLRNVSSVVTQGTAQGRSANFNIRGFGNPLGNSVPVLRDGYRIYGNFDPIPEVANLEQVEVLKGPASILYGQIEPGGIINLVSKKPLSEPFAEVELQLGNYGLVRPRFDLSGPLSRDGQFLYRLNGLYKHEWSFRDFDIATERYSIAPVIALKIDDRTDMEFSVEYINDRGPADFGISQFGKGVAPIPRSRVINDPNDTLNKDYVSAGYSFEHRFNDDWKIRNGFRYLSYNYNYSVVALPFNADGPIVTRFYADQEGQQQSYSLFTSVAGKFATGSIKHELLAGIDLNHNEDRVISDFGGPSPINIFNPDYNLASKPTRADLLPFNNTLNTSSRLGIYLQDQISLLDNLILVAGFRYDTVTQDTTNVQTNFTEGGRTEQSNDAVTPRVGLLYRPIPELSIFANYSQSFNPSTATRANGNALEPERGEGFEVGLKTELFDQKLLATLTYFNITKQNVAVTDPFNPLFSSAIGEQQSQGVELDIVGEILPGWNIIGSYSYIDAKVTQDTDPDFVNNRLFGVPYNMASLWMTYEIQKGALQGLGFGAGFNYVGDRFGDLANSYTVGDYIIGNMAIFYNRDNYRVALNFKNISNANYIQSVTGNQAGIDPGQPFSVIGSFSVQF